MLKYALLLHFIISFSYTTLLAKDINIDLAIKKSSSDGRKVLVYLHRIGCSYCNSMQEFTIEDDDIEEYIEENHTFVTINVSLEDTIIYKGRKSSGLDFAKSIGYNFYPSTIFLGENAEILYATPGYKNEYEFMLILKYMKLDIYKKMDLATYKKKIGYIENSQDQIEDKRKHGS